MFTSRLSNKVSIKKTLGVPSQNIKLCPAILDHQQKIHNIKKFHPQHFSDWIPIWIMSQIRRHRIHIFTCNKTWPWVSFQMGHAKLLSDFMWSFFIFTKLAHYISHTPNLKLYLKFIHLAWHEEHFTKIFNFKVENYAISQNSSLFRTNQNLSG